MAVQLTKDQFETLQKLVKDHENKNQVEAEEVVRTGNDRYLDDCPPAFVPCDPAVMNCPPDNLGSHYVDKHGKRCFAREDVKEYYRKYTEPSTQEIHSEMMDLTTMIARTVRAMNHIRTKATKVGENKYEISADQVCQAYDDERFCGNVPFGKDGIECVWQKDECRLKGAAPAAPEPASSGSFIGDFLASTKNAINRTGEVLGLKSQEKSRAKELLSEIQ